jgi:hypothetical protein
LRSRFEAITQPFTKPQVRSIETAPAPDPIPVQVKAVPTPEPVVEPEEDFDDEPLTLTPTLTPAPQTVTALEPDPMDESLPTEEPLEQAPLDTEAPVTDAEPLEKRWVVEPEVPFENPDGEPDLFSQHIPHRQPVTLTPLAAVEAPKKKEPSAKHRAGGIFNMSRLDTSPVADTPKDEHAAMRQLANLKTFVDSFKRLGATTLSRGFSDNFFQQYRYVLITAAAILLICMLTGVVMLFTMTQKPKVELTSQKFQQVAPIPALYAD